MKIEVEIKAHVDDPERLRRILVERFGQGEGYLKEDVYFALAAGAGGLPAGAAAADAPREFRLRRENGLAFVTFKRKSLEAGVEANEETEFTVDDPAAFESFAGFLGAKVFSRKRKEGLRFRSGDLTIELSDVARLGWFIEIEMLVEAERTDRIEKARKDVRAVLASLEIGEDRIEPRYYTDMLAELGR